MKQYAVWAVGGDGYIAAAPWREIGVEAPWHFPGYAYLGSVEANDADEAREKWAALESAGTQ